MTDEERKWFLDGNEPTRDILKLAWRLDRWRCVLTSLDDCSDRYVVLEG